MPVWYIMDEFGSRIQHSIDKSPSFRLVPFLCMLDGCAYSILFPVKECDNGDEVTRDYLEGPEARDEGMRKALLNIWQNEDLTTVDWKQVEPPVDFFASNRSNETLPENIDELEKSQLSADRKIKVFSHYSFIRDHLKHPRFEIVDSLGEADILWLNTHFKEFK